MAIKSLVPIRESHQDFEPIREQLSKLFKEEIYYPLLREIGFKKDSIQNAKDDLLRAIQGGQITYSKGKFKGNFNSTLSRELRKIGAEWDRSQGCWSIPQSELTIEIKNAISLSETKWIQTIHKLDDKLKSIMPAKIAEKLKLEKQFDSLLFKIDKKLEKSLENISVQPKLTDAQRFRISEEYTTNMELFVKDFIDEQVTELRKKVETRTFDGFRYEGMIKSIQKSYNVSENKAKFLARQETQLYTSKLKEVRYEKAGVTKYRWVCSAHPKSKSPNERTPGMVRYYHALNNGKIFSFAEGAVVNAKGEKKNPGEDYNCNCIAVPVFES